MKRQQGSLLIELGVVVAILIVISSWALPELSRSMTQHKMEAASQTVRQAIQRARLMARNRNTWVEISLSQGQLTLIPDNNNNQIETIVLPRDVVFGSDLNLRYTPNGLLQRSEQNSQTIQQITLHANNGHAADINIRIDAMGWVSL